MVENGGSGSKAAAPVARQVLDLYFGEPVAFSTLAATAASDDGSEHSEHAHE